MTIPTPSQFRPLQTRDGSWTLELTGPAGPENMHNFHGAWSESKYLYGQALERALEFIPSPLRVLSLGTGLGYNEFLSHALVLTQKLRPEILLDTYESDVFLREAFQDFLSGKTSPLDPIYSDISWRCLQDYNLPQQETRQFLQKQFQVGKLEIHEEFTPALVPLDLPYHVVFYDPFSAKTNAQFWTRSNLDLFLSNVCAEECVFSTYAATGDLKRALEAQGFALTVRAGFGGKRNCFLAARRGQRLIRPDKS